MSKLTASTSFALFALLAASPSLIGCATEGPDDELDPACEAKCDDAGGTAGFEVFEGQDGAYYFHLLAGNGEIVLQSQAYTTRSSAKRGAESVGDNGVDVDNYRVLEAVNGEWYVNLVAGNGQIIASTETYTRKFNAKRAIDTAVGLVSQVQRIRAAAEGGARFKVLRGTDSQIYFNLRGGNGEVMLQSEGYAGPGGVAGGIESVRAHGKDAANYQVLEAAGGQHYVRLRAANNEIIARTETYASKENAERAVERLVELIASELIADPEALPPVPARELADFPDLKLGLDALGDIAAKGVPVENVLTLAYFGYAEGLTPPPGSTCEDAGVSAEQVLESFSGGIVDLVLSGSPNPPELDAAAREAMQVALVQYLGDDEYRVCQDATATAPASGRDTVRYYMTSTDEAGPRMSIELGWDVGISN